MQIRPAEHNRGWLLLLSRGSECVEQCFATECAAHTRKRYNELLVKLGMDPLLCARLQKLCGCSIEHAVTLVSRGLRIIQSTESLRVNPDATYNEAIDKRLAEAAADPDYKNLHILVSKYNTIRRGIGHIRIIDGGVPIVAAYLEGLSASASTKDDYAGLIISALCALGIHDPLPGLPVFAEPGPVEFFSIEEIVLILSATPAYARGFVATAIFSFIRPEGLADLDPRGIHLDEREIAMPSYLSKSDTSHLLRGHIDLGGGRCMPGILDVLWEWLRVYPFQRVDWERLREYLSGVLGRWIHDGLRRSGATYYNNLFGRKATIRMLTHGTAQTTSRHYIGVTTRADAFCFMGLGPSSIKFIVP